MGPNVKRPTQGILVENNALGLSHYTMVSIQKEEFTFLGLLVKRAQSKTERKLSNKLALQVFTFKWGLGPTPLSEVKISHAFHFDWPSYYSPHLKECDFWK